jgi:hypothetical protein
MREEDQSWMDYIDDEVRATCEARGWGHQIRRKGAARSKVVTQSPIASVATQMRPVVVT